MTQTLTQTAQADPAPGATTAGGVLPPAAPEELGLDPARLEQLFALIEEHIGAGRYPGAQVAVARHGRLAAFRTFGRAEVDPDAAATDATLWLLYSQTKMLVSATLWQLVDCGALSFSDLVADHLPEFAAKGKGEITVHQLLSHQAGFPNARPGPEVWTDHELLRRTVCDFDLEWRPGTKVQYHGAAAHWVAAVLIEALSGRDYRQVVRQDLLDPLGLRDLFVGVPEAAQGRCADMHVLRDGRPVALDEARSAAFRAAGVPGGGGYGTAAALAAFYQMLAAGGALNGTRVLSPRVIAHATRKHTGDRVDDNTGATMNRGLGPVVRGLVPPHAAQYAPGQSRGMGAIASPATFGHGGAGSSFSWADPEAGLSFSYLSNCRAEDPFHSRRLDRLSNLVHAALVQP
jgi:CubicO group peptidase (beta-lactamase class C family)